MKNYKKKESTKQRERRVAKEVGGERVPASGATPWAKEDLIADDFLFQHKNTERNSITVTQVGLENLRKNAIDEGLHPAYVMDFPQRRYFIIEENLFNELREHLKDV